MSLRSVRHYLFGTLRGRLIISVAAVHALMMTLFIIDSTVRQRELLLGSQVREAVAMSQSLATSSAHWIAADDLAGLQELADAQRRYPEMIFTALTDEQGRVLAHTDTSKLGLYLVDLPDDHQPRVLSRSPALVDVAVPARIGDRTVGWARIGIGQRAAAGQLSEMTVAGISYAVGAVVLGSLIAWRMGVRITRRLYAVQDTIGEVRRGVRTARSHIRGSDEAASIAGEFNTMLDTLDERDRALQESETRYRQLLKNIQAAVVVHGPDTGVRMSNPMAQRLLGLPEEQMAGRVAMDPAWRLLRKDGSVLPVEEYPVNLALTSRSPVRNLTLGILAHEGGEPLWALANADPVLDPGGAVTEVVVTFVDITERRRAEEALRESEERYRLLHECAGVGIGYYAPDGTVISFNQLAADHMGGRPEDFNGRSIHDLYPKDEADVYLSRIRRSIAARSPIEYEDYIELPVGGKWFLSVFARIGDAQGRVTGIQIISQDITDRKVAEQEVRRLNQELERRVVERTAQLAAANKELEAFAYSVSHDLRAPLRHIDSFMELLRGRLASITDEQSQHYMTTIAGSVRRMGLLIDDLLSFSRMGRRDLSRQPVDLNELLQEVIEQAEPDTRGRDIRWQIAELPTVTGDRAMLHVVLDNLISNAVKFTARRDRARIEVGFTRDGDEIVVFVRDNGVGFSMDYASKLFGVFQRLHGPDEFEGTGIGLANVRRVITRHGGRTWADGEPDRGATFYFSLPQGAPSGQSPAEPGSPPPLPPGVCRNKDETA